MIKKLLTSELKIDSSKKIVKATKLQKKCRQTVKLIKFSWKFVQQNNISVFCDF